MTSWALPLLDPTSAHQAEQIYGLPSSGPPSRPPKCQNPAPKSAKHVNAAPISAPEITNGNTPAADLARLAWRLPKPVKTSPPIRNKTSSSAENVVTVDQAPRFCTPADLAPKAT